MAWELFTGTSINLAIVRVTDKEVRRLAERHSETRQLVKLGESHSSLVMLYYSMSRKQA